MLLRDPLPVALEPRRPVRRGASASLRPPEVGRDLRLDTLRGFMLMAMAINHLDTELRIFTDHVFGFVTTAEGFVFLSGLVAGLVYTRQGAYEPRGELRRRAWHRAGEIYLYHLAGFALALIGLLGLRAFAHIQSNTSPPLFFSHPGEALVLGASLLYQPGLLDILPMYCVFMFLLPLLLRLLDAGHGRWVVAGSLVLWLLAQFGLQDALEHQLQLYVPVNFGAFDETAWQLFFILGVCCGHRRASGGQPVLSFRPAMLVICLAAAIPLWLLKNQYLPLSVLPFDIWAWSNKSHLAPVRLVNFIIIAYLIAAVAVHRPRFFVIRPVAFLGRHSLPVFAFEAVVTLFLLTQPQLSATFGRRTAVALGMVALLYLPAWLHARYQSRRRATARQEAPYRFNPALKSVA